MYFSKESIDNLKSNISITEVLTFFCGVPPSAITENSSEVRCPCPIHGGDNADGFSFKKNEGLWTCFTHNCGEGGKRDVIELVRLTKHISFVEAVKELADHFGCELESENIDNKYRLLAKDAYSDVNRIQASKLSTLKALSSLPGFYPEGQSYIDQYLSIRNLNLQELKDNFQFYPCKDRNGFLRLGIPAFDDQRNLVGVNSRRLDGVLEYPETVVNYHGKVKKVAKYDMVANFKKSSVLFNLHKAKEFSEEKGLILVEGELSAVRMFLYGHKNCVAVRGSMLSKEQAMLLYKYCFEVTFLVEEGAAAEKGVLASIEKLPGMRIKVAKLQHGDPDDNSKEEVQQALDNSVYYSNAMIQESLEKGALLNESQL